MKKMREKLGLKRVSSHIPVGVSKEKHVYETFRLLKEKLA
jgi:hypothetical protein